MLLLVIAYNLFGYKDLMPEMAEVPDVEREVRP